MKPLVRWIIGPVKIAGFYSIALSVLSFKKLYGDDFDYLICHNQLSELQTSRILRIGIPLKEQKTEEFKINPIFWEESINPLHEQKTRNCWKLHPPRLRLDCHEIILDNDVIIKKRINEIDDFLKGDHVLATEAICRSYGRLDEFIIPNLNINTGLIGLPPRFDLESKLKLSILKDEWQSYFDEQALIAEAIQHNVKLIPRDRICYGDPSEWDRPFYHFVGINYMENHPNWKKYIARII